MARGRVRGEALGGRGLDPHRQEALARLPQPRARGAGDRGQHRDERERAARDAGAEVGAPRGREPLAERVDQRARHREHHDHHRRAQRDADLEDAVDRGRPRERGGHQQREHHRHALALERHAGRKVAQQHQHRERADAEDGAGQRHAQPAPRVGGARAAIGAGEQHQRDDEAGGEPQAGEGVQELERGTDRHAGHGQGEQHERGREQHGGHAVGRRGERAERAPRAVRLREQREEVHEQRGQEQRDAGVERVVDRVLGAPAEARPRRDEPRERQAHQEEGAREPVAPLAPHPATQHHEARGHREQQRPDAALAVGERAGDERDLADRRAPLAQQRERHAGRRLGERVLLEIALGARQQAVVAPEARALAGAARDHFGHPVAAHHHPGVGLARQAQGREHQRRGDGQQRPGQQVG